MWLTSQANSRSGGRFPLHDAGPRSVGFGTMEGKMHPRHGEFDAKRTNLLAMIAAVLLLAVSVATVIKYDLWQVPEDQSATLFMLGAPAQQPMAQTVAQPVATATALKSN